jgi:hypothetical protein
MSKTQVISAVSAERVQADVRTIVRDIPHRAAGSENGRRMAEFSRDAFESSGLDESVVHELPALVSFPEHADFRVEAPQAIAIQANTLGHSLETLPEGLTGELVYVGSGSIADFEGKDVRGKIVLTELSYSPGRHEKQRLAAQRGAIGAVMLNWGRPDDTAVPFGSVKPVWGNPTPETYRTEMATIPCIGISRSSGLQLKALCEQGPVRVWFRTHVRNAWAPVQITVARLNAPAESPEADDFIMVGGHQDSWPGEAATDNAAGNACMYELARVFARHRHHLRRGLMFGLWTAHETGTMAGSTWFADRHWDLLRDHACAYLQIDQPSCTGTTVWHTTSNIELKAFHQGEERALMPDRKISWKRVAKSGDASFIGLGVPMFQGEGAFTEEELKATALATRGWWHHSLECTIDKVDFSFMQTHLQVYAAWLWELCTAPVLPFQYSPLAEQVKGRLSEFRDPPAALGFDRLHALADRFTEASAAFDACAARVRSGFDAGAHGDEAAARTLNLTMKRLSRLLVPLMSAYIGKYGHDPYSFTPQSTLIPALYDVKALEQCPEGEDRWMLETQVVRHRNRIADTLSESIQLMRDAMATVG